MIEQNGFRRYFTRNAVPTLLLPSAQCCSNDIEMSEPSVKSCINDTEMSEPEGPSEEISNILTNQDEILNIKVDETATAEQVPPLLTVKDKLIKKLQKKVEKYKNTYYAGNRKIRMLQRKKFHRALKQNKDWKQLIPGLTDLQITFIEIIQQCMKRKPQVLNT